MEIRENDITNTTRWQRYTQEVGQLLRLGLPIFLTQLGIVAVSFVDTAMVGDYGTNELAASAFVSNFFMVPLVMLIGFSCGLTPLIGALFAKKEHYEVGRTLRVGIYVNEAMSLLMMVVMAVLYFFLDKMGQPPELLPLIRKYYIIILFTMVPAGFFNACQQMANGVTDTKSPMWIILGSNLFNVLGNYMLIYGKWGAPELGLVGAGLSTLMSRIISMAGIYWLVYHTNRYKPYRDGVRHGSVTRDAFNKVFKTSYPVMFQNGAEVLIWSLGAVVCGWFGKLQLAAYQVTNTMSQIGFMTYMSFAVAVSIRVAGKMGVKDYRGIKRTTGVGVSLNFLFSVIASAIFLLWSEPLLGIFTRDQGVIDVAQLLIFPLVLYQLFDATQVTLSNAVRGTSYVKPLLWTSVCCYLLLGVPVMLLIGKVLNYQSIGVYYSFCIVLAAAAVSYFYFFLKTMQKASSQHSET
jgi:MATE family multidrug resistance protein